MTAAPSPEVAGKLVRLREATAAAGLDGVVLLERGSFAWASGGGDSHVEAGSTRGVAALAVPADGGEPLLVASAIEMPRFLAEEPIAGFAPREIPWTEPLPDALGRLLPRGRWASDDAAATGLVSLPAGFLYPLRSALGPQEHARFAALGADAAAAMEEVATALAPGDSEPAVAAGLAAGLLRRGARAPVVLVAFDERLAFRHPIPKSATLRRAGMLVVCAERHGLVASLTRLVHVGPPPEEARRQLAAVCRVEAALWEATVPGIAWGAVLRAGLEAYAREGFPEAWREHHQGGPAGYAPREIVVTPGEERRVIDGQAVAWNPSLPGLKSEDTFLLAGVDRRVVTAPSDGWPTLEVATPGGRVLHRPAILER